MSNIPSARLTVPHANAGEILRKKLIDAVLLSPVKLVYIHAGAGYGKTTLLAQVANSVEKTVWISLNGENDVLTFVDTLCEAVKQTFPEFDFSASEYLPFLEKKNYIAILAGPLVCSIENLPCDFLMVMDDLHTIIDDEVKKLITYLIKYPPKNVKICFGSREALPQEFLSFKIQGRLAELTQKELALTREEVAEMLGFDDPAVFASTEGWPLAIGFFRVLLENGTPIGNIASYGKETLYAYLFNECIAHLKPDMVDFLRKSACFDLLDAQMLDFVLEQKNTRLLLENLVSKNFLPLKPAKGFTAITRFSEADFWKRWKKSRFFSCSAKPPGIILTQSSTRGLPATRFRQRTAGCWSGLF